MIRSSGVVALEVAAAAGAAIDAAKADSGRRAAIVPVADFAEMRLVVVEAAAAACDDARAGSGGLDLGRRRDPPPIEACSWRCHTERCGQNRRSR